MSNFKALGVCFLFGTTLAFAQSAAPQTARPSFEVASIRPSAAMPPTGGGGGVRITKGQFHSAFMSLKVMMTRAAVSAGVPLPPEALRLLDASSPASMFDELRKLGLNLVPRTAPLDLVVVDNIEKTPTEN